MQAVTGLASNPMCPRLDEASRRIGQRRDATRAPNWGRSSRFRASHKEALSLLIALKTCLSFGLYALNPRGLGAEPPNWAFRSHNFKCQKHSLNLAWDWIFNGDVCPAQFDRGGNFSLACCVEV